MDISLDWLGPYTLIPQEGHDCILDRAESDSFGLYLWTVELNDGYLVNYVGETGRSFWERFAEHLTRSLAGREGIVSDPEQFRLGHIVTHTKWDYFVNYLSDYTRLSAVIYELHLSYRVFIAPTTVGEVVRKDIEAGIIKTLKCAGGQVAGFLSNRSRSKRLPERLSVKFVSSRRFHGIESIVEC